MKSEGELKSYLDAWIESLGDARSEYERGMFVGYVLALSTAIGDKESKDKARAAIQSFKERAP